MDSLLQLPRHFRSGKMIKAALNRQKQENTMNEKAIRILEYPKIITQLTECATSAPGRHLCRELLPSADLHQVLAR